MNNFFAFSLTLVLMMPLAAQDHSTLPEFHLDREVLKGQMYFLASDYLAGRRTGSKGNEIAAAYIASHLEAFGYTPINEGSYFQDVPLQSISSPERSSLQIGETTFTPDENLLVMRGVDPVEAEAKVVFAGYGWVDEESGHDDFKGLNVKGKIVITLPGLPDDNSQQGIFKGLSEKPTIAAEKGAVALFEIYQLPFPWGAFTRYFGGDRVLLKPDEDENSSKIPYGFIKVEDDFLVSIKDAKKLKGVVKSSGLRVTEMDSRNVGGVLEGSDPELKDEYMILTAHFDHVGVGSQGGGAYSPEDSIFNGARDNAFGTISLLSAAKSFAEVRPKRSIIILAVTGEEMGLLGSQYYAEHPLIPLEKTVYNFNTDGAGYSDTSAISIFGMGRTGVDEEINEGAAAFNLKVIGDPAPEQGLYDRSDNVSFAAIRRAM
ncbi:MAG: M28 family peptidase [Bacteroidota bacterium]